MPEDVKNRVPINCQLPRDERGWRMPRLGTKSARIYDLLIAGKTSEEILAEIGGSRTSIRVLTWKIRNPVEANKRGYIDYQAKKARS